jgi:hypothetical protein
MFDSKMTFAERLTDAVDLLIDFATLGEYGLEPVSNPAPDCESRRRPCAPEARKPASLSRPLAAQR